MSVDHLDHPDPEPAAPGHGAPPFPEPARTFPPDFTEEALGPELDNIIPTRGYQLTPLVGLGGSAGSISALTEFFQAMPVDSGLVFVVVLHLSPEHESALAAVLQRQTAMPVITAQDGAALEKNHVYVIPPGKHLVTADGHLRLRDLTSVRGRRMAVDIFFRTLAETHGPHAAAIVLSGVDGDGAIGLKRIKERGGLTIAQDPAEAEYAGMPSTAIETGMVDWVLKVHEMPARLLDYTRREARLRLPHEDGPPPDGHVHAADEAETALRDVLAYLRTRTGRDFSYYKRATILRRISRRMQVNGRETVPEYLTFLRTHPGESGALLQDLLISVTNFFRDRDAFLALEERIPGVFRGKGPNDTVRAWCPACATGEEAYSIAILLSEHARTLEAPPAVQVFATDLDEDVVQSARDGIYPDTIATDVSEERLRRFFVKEHRGYRVRRELREGVLFALHDLLKDAPFSRLDLVSCRNLLIYLNQDAQRRALDIFHFALRPGGTLFLGSSESAEDAVDLFAPLDKKHRIYQPRPSGRVRLPVPIGASTLARAFQEKERAGERPAVPQGAMLADAAVPPTWNRLEIVGDRAASFNEIHLRLFEQHGPPSLLINDQHDILHLSGSAGRYLQFTGGEPTRNLMRVVHPMLRIELRAALYRAAQSGQPAEALDVPFDAENHPPSVDIYLAPGGEPRPAYFLIVFVPHPALHATPRAAIGPEADPVAQQLERELEEVKSSMREMLEQHEVTIEEQKAGNEELQAINEELRSATEELETSREELQSINEELTTVNQELKGKVDELAHSNSDLHNLMNATAIATVFLDRDLRIARYTPTATALFNLIPTDVGRPLSDLKDQLDYPDLDRDAARVLEKLAPIEREVGKPGRGWFLARLLPYRSIDDHIGGVVLTFVDITERKRNEQALRESKETLQLVIENAREYAIFTTDLDMKVTTWNSGAERLLLFPEREILGRSASAIFTPEDRAAQRPEQERDQALNEGRASDERWHQRKDGSRFWSSGFLMAMHDASGRAVGFVKILRDATEERTAQHILEESRAELQAAMSEIEKARDMAEAAALAKDHFLAVLSHELRTPLTPVLIAAGGLARRGDLPADVIDALEMITSNVQMEARFIDELLDLTRISHGKMELILVPIDVHEAIRRAIQVCEGDVQEKKLALETDLGAAAHRLLGDSGRLQQVVWNLLKNAAKFTPTGGRIHLRTLNPEPGWITIEVSDTGIGIDAAVLPKIFNSFEQADGSVTRQFGGLGLGLAISTAIVDAHHGTLTAASPGLGRGATFIVKLPLIPDNPPAPPA